ncbi:MAG: L-fucose:H+ symporter permease, partial [Bacteroidota bacterium]
MDSSRKAPLVPKALIFPFIIITSLFFLWGIANDLTNPMVSAFKKVMPELSNFEAALVQFAFYGGYATMAIPAALFIRRFSYKSGIIVGLLLYAVGAFLFYPAAEYEVFGYFLASLYILTFGLAFLETTANPFILAMGEEQTATRRLNLSQAFNPMGSLLGMLVAQLLVIQSLQSDDYSAEAYAALEATTKATIRENDLGIISYPYLLLGGLVLVILVIVALTKFPSIREHATLTLKDSFRKLVINKRYLGGVLGIAFTVGCQI